MLIYRINVRNSANNKNLNLKLQLIQYISGCFILPKETDSQCGPLPETKFSFLGVIDYQQLISFGP